jgi:galactokinase
VPAVDLLVELARADADLDGARMTGGGFGGSVVMLAQRGRGRAAAERIAGEYAARSGRSPTVLVPFLSQQ